VLLRNVLLEKVWSDVMPRHNTAELLQFEMEAHDGIFFGFVIVRLAFFCRVSVEMCGCNAVAVKSVPCSLHIQHTILK
jgi:hypothetical protein